MSFQSDLVTALAGVAGGRVFPGVAEEKTPYPLVNYRILNKAPITTIDGKVHAIDYQVVFECWADSNDSALATAESVRAAVRASTLNYTPIEEPGQDYEPQADSYMEPVYYEFMHA